MTGVHSKKLRILYAAGPGNVIGTYQHWLEGRDDPSQVGITWSGQFYDLTKSLGAEAYVISSHCEREAVRDNDFTVEHRPVPFRQTSSILYHLGMIWYGIHLLISAIRFRASVAIVNDGTTHWFLLSLFPLFKIQVIPTIQCVLWRKFTPKRFSEHLLLKLGQRFFQKDALAILSMSQDITDQIQEITAHKSRPIVNYLPVYRREQFAEVKPPSEVRSPFRVLYVGRIEFDKGVFDLLEVAKQLNQEGRKDILFDLCGDGTALPALKLAVEDAGLSSIFVCHGHCQKSKMREMFNLSHTVIVPTRTDFVEGFNQVVSEGVLSGRPVVASQVCPAVYYVRDAIVEVTPNDVEGYKAALLKLCDDREFYEKKRLACRSVEQQFYVLDNSWGVVLKSILSSIQKQDLTVVENDEQSAKAVEASIY